MILRKTMLAASCDRDSRAPFAYRRAVNLMESAMLRILLPFCTALVACTPSPQEAAMHDPAQLSATTPDPVDRRQMAPEQAAQGPIVEPVSAAANPAPILPMDTPIVARGRQILSTAFVRVGPDGHLTVELRDGRELILRDVAMGPKDYCGLNVSGGRTGTRYCGGYAEVTAARPGGAPAPDMADPAKGVALEPGQGSARHR